MDPSGAVYVPADILDRHPNAGVWRVIGDAMIGDRIVTGDYIVVDPDEDARDGDIAAVWVSDWRNTITGALVANSLVVGRLQCGGTVLAFSHSEYPPMNLQPEHNPIIEGCVVGVVHPIA
jgi:SOS-response transcriptional repressor LexA